MVDGLGHCSDNILNDEDDMTVKMIEIRVCDLCETEDGKDTPATTQYSKPDLCDGVWFDSCKKHADQMRQSGGYDFRRVQ